MPLEITLRTAAHWTDNPCWYCSIFDAERRRHGLLLGPFETEAACREWAYDRPEDGGTAKHYSVTKAAHDADPWSAFYAFGMVKMPNGKRPGVLNDRISDWGK